MYSRLILTERVRGENMPESPGDGKRPPRRPLSPANPQGGPPVRRPKPTAGPNAPSSKQPAQKPEIPPDKAALPSGLPLRDQLGRAIPLGRMDKKREAANGRRTSPPSPDPRRPNVRKSGLRDFKGPLSQRIAGIHRPAEQPPRQEKPEKRPDAPPAAAVSVDATRLRRDRLVFRSLAALVIAAVVFGMGFYLATKRKVIDPQAARAQTRELVTMHGQELARLMRLRSAALPTSEAKTALATHWHQKVKLIQQQIQAEREKGHNPLTLLRRSYQFRVLARLEDEWGRPLLFLARKDGGIAIISPGADGVRQSEPDAEEGAGDDIFAAVRGPQSGEK